MLTQLINIVHTRKELYQSLPHKSHFRDLFNADKNIIVFLVCLFLVTVFTFMSEFCRHFAVTLSRYLEASLFSLIFPNCITGEFFNNLFKLWDPVCKQTWIKTLRLQVWHINYFIKLKDIPKHKWVRIFRNKILNCKVPWTGLHFCLIKIYLHKQPQNT